MYIHDIKKIDTIGDRDKWHIQEFNRTQIPRIRAYNYT